MLSGFARKQFPFSLPLTNLIDVSPEIRPFEKVAYYTLGLLSKKSSL